MNLPTNKLAFVGMLTVSMSIHGAAYAALGWVEHKAAIPPPRPPSIVAMEIAAPPVPVPLPPAAPVPVAREKTAPAVKLSARPISAPSAIPQTAPPAAAMRETAADFSGVTLTNDGPGEGWGSAVGNGARMEGAIGAPNAIVTGRNVAGIPVVGLADLSAPPRPPALDGELAKHYPAQAKAQGITGRAVVRARIEPDGSVGRIRVVSESSDGFGEACKRTLEESRWTAPRDRDGREVSTEISYTCRFEVGT